MMPMDRRIAVTVEIVGERKGTGQPKVIGHDQRVLDSHGLASGQQDGDVDPKTCNRRVPLAPESCPITSS